MGKDGFELNERNGQANGELLDRLDLRHSVGNRITGLTFETATGKMVNAFVSNKKGGKYKFSQTLSNDDSNELNRLLDSSFEEFKQTPTGRMFGKLREKVGNIRNKAVCVLAARFKAAENVSDGLQWDQEDLGVYDNQSVALDETEVGASTSQQNETSTVSQQAVDAFLKDEEKDEGLKEAKERDILSNAEEREITSYIPVERMLNMMSDEIDEVLNAEERHHTFKRVDALTKDKPKRERYFKRKLERIEEQREMACVLDEREPKTERIKQMLEENLVDNDVTRLERFKKFVKDNALSLVGITIMFGTLVTSIVMAARSAIRKGATVTSKLARAVYNIGKKVAPLLSPIVSLIGTALSLGAKGVSWLAQNLWVLAILLAWLFYDQVKEQVRKRRKK